MKVAINEHIGGGTFNYDVDQTAQIIPFSKEVADRLKSTTVDEALWDKISSHRFLLIPYSGISAKNVANVQVVDADKRGIGEKVKGKSNVGQVSTEVRKKILHRFCDVAAAYTDKQFYQAIHNPAWVAMLLEDNAELNGSVLKQLNASHVLVASLLASHVGEQPLRSIVDNAKQIYNTELQPKVFIDGLGRKFPEYKKDASQPGDFERDNQGKFIPEMESVVVGEDWDNQYWQTADSFSPNDKSDMIIVGDTRSSGTLLTRRETFAGNARTAKGVIIPV